MAQRGKLIVIDGSDGVGKATQTALLVERLKKEGHTVHTLDFPRYKDNFFGAFVRECLDGVHGNFVGTDPYLASLPYAADRFESKPILEGWLKDGAVVVLDRYVSANQMHQGGKIAGDEERARFLEWLDTMEHTVFGIPRPDMIIYLHMPISVSQSLMAGRAGKKDQHENDPEHLANAQESALKLIQARSHWQRVECARNNEILTRQEIHEMIWRIVSDTLGI
jgi:dTMP kinase